MPVREAHIARNVLYVLIAITLQKVCTAMPVHAGAELQDIRIGLTPGRTRVVFDVSGPFNFQLQEGEKPSTMIIELEDTTAAVALEPVSTEGTPISKLALASRADDNLSIVLTLSQQVETSVFSLKPFELRGDRLVIDLYSPAPVKVVQSEAEYLSDLTPRAANARLPANKPPVTTPFPGSSVSRQEQSEVYREWTGSVSLDTRLFPEEPEYPGQDDQNASIAAQTEYYSEWADGRQQFSLRAFYRWDANDHRRTHGDLREFYWRFEHEDIVFKAGLDVVFWGVAESQHLVDIINQTDLVENIDGEEKLGQPMFNLDYLSDYGVWQLYVLPYFRERTFPGRRGRLRTEPVVDTDNPEYESSSKQKHIDFAGRWSNYIGDWDIGLSHFSGTAREPLFKFDNNNGKPRLIPVYLQIEQSSLDVQATKGAWLWKLESLYNWNNNRDYFATVGGFEFTQFGFAGSVMDVGWLVEYHYDERGKEATNGLQNDIYIGTRLTGNDFSSSAILVGLLYDLDLESYFGNIEASRRIGEFWTLGIELRFTTNTQEQDNLFFIREDDYLGVELTRYF
ncbi:MAG: AMIN domain-containing protein [Pseudomonadota bacterium]